MPGFSRIHAAEDVELRARRRRAFVGLAAAVAEKYSGAITVTRRDYSVGEPAR
jgi:hypothetical protein